MARTLNIAQSLEIAQRFGSRPALIIEIDYGVGFGITTYADVNFIDDSGIIAQGKILQVSGLDAVLKLGSTGTSVNLSVTVDDTEDIAHSALNTVDIQGVPCRVYQGYLDLGPDDKFLLFSGELASPFIWSEREQTFRFDIVTNIEDHEIGFSPEEGEFEFIADSAVGKAWPLCFGRPLRVPAVKITERVRGTSLTRYGAISQGDLNSLCSAAEAVDNAENEKSKADNNPAFSDEAYEEVIDALNDTQISLNTNKEALIFDSPTQETNLELYIEVCKDNAAEQRNFDFWTAESLAKQTEVTTIEAAIVVLEAQIIEQQAISPPTAESTALIISLSAQKVTQEAALITAQIEFANTLVQLVASTASLEIHAATKTLLEQQLTQIVITEIIVDNGENFPQGSEVAIIVNNLKFSGIFTDKTFAIGSVIATDTDIELTERENTNTNELWVDDATIDISRKYCFIPGKGIIYIENQQGARCQYSPILFELTGDLGSLFGVEGDAATREVYDAITLNPGDTIIETSAIIFDHWKASLSTPNFANGLSKASDDDWNIEVGDEVYLDVDYTDLYIANLIPSTSVIEVFARRTINGVEKLLPVPSSRYTITLSEEIAGQNATTIRFDRPLSQYVGEDWSDEVFVSLISSEGPNTSNVIKYLIQTYTNLIVDTTSFDAVVTSLILYPSDFALLQRVDALITIEEIAWQARCAVIIKNGVAFLKYLAAEKTEVITVSESEVNNFEVTLSNSDDLVTRFTAIWKRDLSAEENDKVVLRNNIAKYGLLEEEFNFYIYNIKELVTKSASFWLIRMSNTWKIIIFTAYLDTLELESFDIVELLFAKNLIAVDLDFPLTDPVSTKAIVQKAEYDSALSEIRYEVLTPLLSGDTDPHTLFWPATAGTGIEYPTDKDLFAGGG